MSKTLAINNRIFTTQVMLLGAVLMCILFVPKMSAAQLTAQNCTNPTDPVNGFLIDPDGNTTTVPCCVDDGQGQCVQVPDPDGGTQNLSNDGIFGCLGLGAQIQNVGTRSAIGGVYVPVNDAAVTVNTGFLVYKECILDGTTRKIAENVTAEYARQQLQAFNEGRNGAAQFVEDEYGEFRRQNDIIVVNILGDANVGVLCPAFKTTVRAARARTYITQRNKPNAAFTCTLPSGDSATLWDRLAALRDPYNNPYGADLIVQSQIERTIAYNELNQRERWLRSNGVYDLVSDLNDPLGARITTPGYFIAQSIAQTLGSGFRQLENANEIDQVVGNLFGGLTTQLIADTRGLIGLTQSVNGQQSYLDRMTAQTSANVRQQATNAALSVIGAALQIETSFRQAKEGIATALSSAIEQLRAAERQCWSLVVPAVETRAAQGTCTINALNQQTCDGIAIPITVATSTQFSQQIIDTQIAPLATTTINDIRTSDSAIALLQQLVASVSNSASQANQQQALLRLDTLVANRQLHTATDASNAATQRDNVVSAVTTLVQDTITAWGDSTDPNIGWCNVNNPDVIERWLNEWRT